MFSHPITSTKCPFLSLASGEKKRKALALEVTLQVSARLWACQGSEHIEGG